MLLCVITSRLQLGHRINKFNYVVRLYTPSCLSHPLIGYIMSYLHPSSSAEKHICRHYLPNFVLDYVYFHFQTETLEYDFTITLVNSTVYATLLMVNSNKSWSSVLKCFSSLSCVHMIVSHVCIICLVDNVFG